MSERKRKNTRNTRDVEVNASLIRAISECNLTTVQKLVHSYGLSHCEEWQGGFTLLCKAVSLGHTKITEFLLQEGAETNCKTDHVDTPLHFAAELRCVGLELVRLLLNKNAQINAQNSQNITPLHLAAKEGYVETVRVLLENDASVTAQTNEGLTPLFLALEGRHFEIVRLLLNHARGKVDISSNSPLLKCILLSNSSICDKVNKLVVDIVIEENDNSNIVDDLVGLGFSLSCEFVSESLLFAATKKNLHKLIESIVRNGASRNDVKYSPLLLHTAVKNGCCGIVKLFLDEGFDVNVEDEEGKRSIFYSLNCLDESKCLEIIHQLLANGACVKDTPELLHTAVKEGFADVCKILIENKADVNALNSNHETPLHLIFPVRNIYCRYNREQEGNKQIEESKHEMIKLFLNNRVDVNIKSTVDGRTAFHRAIMNEQKEAVCIFLDHGVFVDLRSEDNSTPLHLAAERGLKDIVELLCENEANVNARGRYRVTPLHSVVNGESGKGESHYLSRSWVDVVNILLDYGCDINLETSYEETALNLAVAGARSKYADNKREIYSDYYYQHAWDIELYNPQEFDQYKVYRSSSDDDDYIDDEFDPDGHGTVEVLKKHVIKMQVAGMLVNPEDIDLLKGSNKHYVDFKKKCEEEVTQLKRKKLHPQFTLYDLVTNSVNIADVKDKVMMKVLETFDCEAYPVYGSRIANKFKRCKSKFDLLSAGQKSLDALIRISTMLNREKLSLPLELLEEIVSYLNSSEIKSLICCGKGLKFKTAKLEEKNVEDGKQVDVKASLISAVGEGNLADVKKLVVSHDLSQCDGHSLLYNAIKADHIEVAKCLLQKGMNVNCETDHVDTLLHNAVEVKPVDVELVRLLLEKNVPIDPRNDQNETPLHIAAKKGNAEIVQALLDKNASVIAQNNDGCTPLFLAIEGKHEEVVQVILKHTCGSSTNKMPSVFPIGKRNSVLLNHILISDFGLSVKVNEWIVHTVNELYGHSKIIDYLTAYGFVLDYEYVDEPLLHAATVRDYAKLVENILMSDANPKDAKYSPLLLHTAVTRQHDELVKVFLNAGFDVNAKDKKGKTPLCYSLSHDDEGKSVKILRLLFAKGADIKEAPTLLHTAVSKGYLEVCKVLFKNGADINALNAKGVTPFHLAVPVKGNEPTNGRRTQQVRKKNKEINKGKIVKFFLSRKVDTSVKAADGFTAFHYAVKHGREEAVCSFLDSSVDVDLRAEDDSTPLHLAAREGHKNIVKILCLKNANLEACDKIGSTPLHLASEQGHTEIVEMLCLYGVNVNACQNDGLTPLHLASNEGHLKTVEILCKKRANVNAHQKNGWAPLHAAAAAHGQHADVIQMLLDFGADIDARGPNNKTALHYAASKDPEYESEVKVLLDAGCDINAETKDGDTALNIAICEAESYHEEKRRDRRNECLPDMSEGYDYEDVYGDDDDFIDGNDDDEFNPDENQMIETLKKHLMKLKVAGLYVSDKNLKLLDDSHCNITDYEQECKEEVKRLKRMKSNCQFTLFDVLVNIESFSDANKKSVSRFLKSFNFKRYPIYKSLIKSNVKKSVLRLDLVGPGQKAFDTLIKRSNELNGYKLSDQLPNKLFTCILSYLSNSDIKGLIWCVEALEN